MEASPTKRSWPSFISTIRLKVCFQAWGETNGNMPSMTSTRPIASSKVDELKRYLPPVVRPELRMYLKKSEFGSSTMTSLLLLKLLRYASRLR